jgi:PilZ domain-containing protein
MIGAERRQFGRRQTCVHATISPRGRPVVPCVMRDVSEDGALLEVVHPEWLPTRFRLIVEAFGIESDCEIVRRTDVAVGVRFSARIASHFR